MLVVIILVLAETNQSHSREAGGTLVTLSTHGQGTLEDDSSFHPIRVGKLNTSFGWEGVGGYSGTEWVLIDQQS